jgi:hypothetical protein
MRCVDYARVAVKLANWQDRGRVLYVARHPLGARRPGPRLHSNVGAFFFPNLPNTGTCDRGIRSPRHRRRACRRCIPGTRRRPCGRAGCRRRRRGGAPVGLRFSQGLQGFPTACSQSCRSLAGRWTAMPRPSSGPGAAAAARDGVCCSARRRRSPGWPAPDIPGAAC